MVGRHVVVGSQVGYGVSKDLVVVYVGNEVLVREVASGSVGKLGEWEVVGLGVHDIVGEGVDILTVVRGISNIASSVDQPNQSMHPLISKPWSINSGKSKLIL